VLLLKIFLETCCRCVIKKKKELSAILTNTTVRDNIVFHISNRNISASSYSSFSAGVKESIELYVPDIQLRKSRVPFGKMKIL
jgi:hypothetical protein